MRVPVDVWVAFSCAAVAVEESASVEGLAEIGFLAAVVAQSVVAVCLLWQLLLTARFAHPAGLSTSVIVLGLLGVAFTLAYAIMMKQWLLVLAQAALGLGLWEWMLRKSATKAAHASERRPRLPIVAPESADPKSGIHVLPGKSGAVPSRRSSQGDRDV